MGCILAGCFTIILAQISLCSVFMNALFQVYDGEQDSISEPMAIFPISTGDILRCGPVLLAGGATAVYSTQSPEPKGYSWRGCKV